jgi:hypothetical protein
MWRCVLHAHSAVAEPVCADVRAAHVGCDADRLAEPVAECACGAEPASDTVTASATVPCGIP